MPDEVPAIVSNVQRAAALIQEARAIDGMMKLDIRATAEKMLQRGNALVKAQQLCGKGEFDEMLKKNWPEISRRTAYRNMKMATEKARSAIVALVESHTHLQLDDKDGESESGEEETPPLTVAQRKILISLIGTKSPGLAKKLRDGTKKLSDIELTKAMPPSCGKCQRFGPPPRPCEMCAKMRADDRQTLFDPEDEENPESPPKAAPDPYAKAKKLVADASGTLTKLINDDAALYEAMKTCKLVFHPDGGLKFCALAGVAKVIEMVADGETNLGKIKSAYDLASGGFVPPRFERKKR